MIVDLKQRGLKPRAVQIVLPPVIVVRHGPPTQVEIDGARGKKGERCQSRANLDRPLSQHGKLMHSVKCAASATRGSTYQRASRTATPSQCSLTHVPTIALASFGDINDVVVSVPMFIVGQVQRTVSLWNRPASRSARYIAAYPCDPDKAVQDTHRRARES